MSRYRAPLNVDLHEQERSKIYKGRRVDAAMSHAKWAARQCATLILDGMHLDEMDVQTRMAQYLVAKPIRDYATRLTFEIVKNKREGLRWNGKPKTQVEVRA